MFVENKNNRTEMNNAVVNPINRDMHWNVYKCTLKVAVHGIQKSKEKHRPQVLSIHDLDMCWTGMC